MKSDSSYIKKMHNLAYMLLYPVSSWMIKNENVN